MRTGQGRAVAPPGASVSLKHGFAAELANPQRDKEEIEEDEAAEDHGQGEVRKLRDESASEPFTGVNDRIEKHGLLQYRKLGQRAPRVIRAAEENHRGQHER